MTLMDSKNWIGMTALTAGVAACLLLPTGCSNKPAPPTNIIARVGSYEITVDEFKRELEYRQTANRPVISKEALLEEMISQKALLLKAREAGLENDPELRRAYENLLMGKLKEMELTTRIKALRVTTEE